MLNSPNLWTPIPLWGVTCKPSAPALIIWPSGCRTFAGKAAELAARGNEMRGENGMSRSAEGYMTANIAAASARGYPFQLAEG